MVIRFSKQELEIIIASLTATMNGNHLCEWDFEKENWEAGSKLLRELENFLEEESKESITETARHRVCWFKRGEDRFYRFYDQVQEVYVGGEANYISAFNYLVYTLGYKHTEASELMAAAD